MRKKSMVNSEWSRVKKMLVVVIAMIYGLSSVCLLSCNSPFTPKQRGYFKIDFPKKEYKLFNQPGYPYTFEYPVYAEVVKDSTFFGEATENPWWINIDFPQFNGKIYVSYKEIGKSRFDTLVNEAFKLTSKHAQKAESIDDSVIATTNGVHGIFFKVGGEVATAKQFFLTDSTKHFLRGALYFYATPNQDSLGIVNDFVQEDMKHLISTFKWTDRQPIPANANKVVDSKGKLVGYTYKK